MPLDRYREKRDFDRTPEPSGDAAPGQTPRPLMFVIQKHAATRLHYDVRLEMDGVLASWAVPKGPSLDTHDRRLAVHVEDHPIEYGSFEGTIPKGEYGGGTVMVWDRGTYEPKEDMAAGMEKGSLKFILHGEKLQGGFALVRMKPREGDRAENWLLIKERDDHVRPREEYDVTEARPESAATGRDMDQIAAGESSDAAAPALSVPPLPSVARLEEPAGDIPMQLARLVEKAPEGDEWIHEVKYDGYRVRAALEDGVARMLTRTGKDWTDRFEPVARAVASLPVASAIVDGEIVVFGKDGKSDFGALQRALSSSASSDSLSYAMFDLLSLDGWDLRDVPLVQRKELLKALLEAAPDPSPLRYVEHVGGDGSAFHDAACEMDLEGSVSKLGDRPHKPGRTPEWRKVKCLQRQEFVIGGYTDPGGSRHGFGALVLGVFEGGELRYAGRVGTGFKESELDQMTARLESLAVDEPPFADAPEIPGRRLHWVRPELVGEVRFQEWTSAGTLRHPSFLGLRDDKPAAQVVRESAEGSVPAPEGDPPAAGDPPDSTVAGVVISKPDKLLWAGNGHPGVTKLDLARYYERAAEHVLVHLRDRPLTLVRCPHGHTANCFYQKHPEHKSIPGAIHTLDIVEHSGETGVYMYVDDAAGLVSLAQLGVLEIHAWNSCIDNVLQPDRIVFDLDPGPDVAWPQVADAARLIRDALDALGLVGFVKSTGGKGLHVVVPIAPEHDYEAVRAFAKAFVDRIAEHDPAGFTAKMSKALRPGRVFLDYLRNAHGATAVAAYSTRARDGAPVSVPLVWSELDADAAPVLGIDGVIERLETQTADPWAEYERDRRALDADMFSALGIALQEPLEE